MDGNMKNRRITTNDSDDDMIIYVAKPNRTNEVAKYKESALMNKAEADKILVRAKGKAQRIITKV
jgi:hypothetical protein